MIDINHFQIRLRPLIGLPLWAAGRAGNLVWFHFGAQRTVLDDFRKTEKTVGEYALHVQCAWRLTSRLGIEVASRDMYYPASTEPEVDLEDFDWDRQGKNRCDERVARLFASGESNPLIVTNVQISSVGDLKLTLSADHTLDVFPNLSLPLEQWRFFQPYTETEQLVLSSKGLETR